jgi:hypothetical protein
MLHSCGHPHIHRHYQDEGAPGRGDVDRQTGSSVKSAQPSHGEIAALAYSYWEARGRQGGSPAEDWLRAERELRQRA